MKMFNEPKAEVIRIQGMDIITTSDCPDKTPDIPA